MPKSKRHMQRRLKLRSRDLQNRNSAMTLYGLMEKRVEEIAQELKVATSLGPNRSEKIRQLHSELREIQMNVRNFTALLQSPRM